MKQIQLIITALLCSIAVSTTAQVATPSYTNRVSRLIYVGDSTTAGKKHQICLAEVLNRLVLDGKLQAYGTYDSRFTEKRTVKQLKERFYPVDSIEVEDPVTGQRFFKVVTSQVDFSYVLFIRVVEEWAYDAETGTTHIKIVGVAPVRDEYGEDGSFRGRSSMYWLKYGDIQPVLEQFEKDNPEQSLTKAIWANYFE